VRVQTPSSQYWLPRHRTPQSPQFRRSASVFTQAPEHSVPVVHTQVPETSQVLSAGQEPQRPPQPLSPQSRPVQSGKHWQTPPAQNSLGAHPCPQEPQFDSSVLVSTHAPSHNVSEQTHVPEVSQLSPSGQVPQDPPHPSPPHSLPVQSGVQLPQLPGRLASQSSVQEMPKEPVVG